LAPQGLCDALRASLLLLLLLLLLVEKRPPGHQEPLGQSTQPAPDAYLPAGQPDM
jgi:hypothetical protein